MPPPPPACFPFGRSNRSDEGSDYTEDSRSMTGSSATSISTVQSLPDKSAYTQNVPPQGNQPADVVSARTGTVNQAGRSTSRTVTSRAPSRPGTVKPIDSTSRAGTNLSRAGTTQKNAKSLAESAYERRLAEIEPVPRRTVDTAPRLAQLRELMKKEKLDYYIVPSIDAHGSEYNLAPCDKRREWISGFTGSSGTAVISLSNAYLFTDSRYYIQAARELDENWSLQKVGWEGVKNWDEWLLDRAKGAGIGVDSRLISYSLALKLRGQLGLRDSILMFPYQNLIDILWKERPPRPTQPISIHPLSLAGEDSRSKLESIRRWIRSNAPPESSKRTPAQMPIATLLTNLYDIAWVLNLRGSDFPYSPIFMAYFFVSLHSAILFIEKDKLPDQVKGYLQELNILTKGYSDVWGFLRGTDWEVGKVLITADVPFTVVRSLSASRYIITEPYISNRRAIKNLDELEGMRRAYIRDSLAFVRLLAWVEHEVLYGEVDEFQVSENAEEFRIDTELYERPAYETIAAAGPNAALPHYVPRADNAKLVTMDALFLIDTGGQYQDGTCDTTRTVHFGKPTPEQCEAYTRVVQGHIALASAVFPEGTYASRLDVLARKELWKRGMNYGHSTGNGIGAFLSARESAVAFHEDVPLAPGHTISNEPGYYKEKEFGIRIESTYAVIVVSTDYNSHDRRWLGFERLTHVPIQTKMLRGSLLSKEEKDWIVAHNAECYRFLEPYFRGDKETLKWLRKECQAGIPGVKGGLFHR